MTALAVLKIALVNQAGLDHTDILLPLSPIKGVHHYRLALFSFSMILNINAFPFRKFCAGFSKG